MTKALEIKLLAAILAVLSLMAAWLVREGRPVAITEQDRRLERKLAQKTQPSAHRYVVP